MFLCVDLHDLEAPSVIDRQLDLIDQVSLLLWGFVYSVTWSFGTWDQFVRDGKGEIKEKESETEDLLWS